ncbi:hypothetical protein ABPG74_000774 [Tetrahymena malaccensis]
MRNQFFLLLLLSLLLISALGRGLRKQKPTQISATANIKETKTSENYPKLIQGITYPYQPNLGGISNNKINDDIFKIDSSNTVNSTTNTYDNNQNQGITYSSQNTYDLTGYNFDNYGENSTVNLGNGSDQDNNLTFHFGFAASKETQINKNESKLNQHFSGNHKKSDANESQLIQKKKKPYLLKSN